jgi:hypothetical protein
VPLIASNAAQSERGLRSWLPLEWVVDTGVSLWSVRCRCRCCSAEVWLAKSVPSGTRCTDPVDQGRIAVTTAWGWGRVGPFEFIFLPVGFPIFQLELHHAGESNGSFVHQPWFQRRYADQQQQPDPMRAKSRLADSEGIRRVRGHGEMVPWHCGQVGRIPDTAKGSQCNRKLVTECVPMSIATRSRGIAWVGRLGGLREEGFGPFAA